MNRNMTLRFARRQLLTGAAAALAMPAVFIRAAFAVTPAEIKTKGKVVVGN